MGILSKTFKKQHFLVVVNHREMSKQKIEKYERFTRFLSRHGFRRFGTLKKLNIFIHKILIRPYYEKRRKEKVMVGGNMIYLDKNDSLGLSLKDYEPFETKLVKEFVKKNDTAIDVGANIGYYTLILAKIVGEKGRVYAFEPDPENFKLLEKNIKVNHYKNVTAVNKAVGSENSKVNLYLSEENKGNHKIYNDSTKRSFVEVDLISLDSFFKKQKIDFIKMDVEGSEAGVINGAKSLLLKNKPLLFTEFCPLFIEQFGYSPKKYLKDLSALGFDFYLIDDGKEVLKKVTKEEIQKITTPLMGNHIDLLCLPKCHKT